MVDIIITDNNAITFSNKLLMLIKKVDEVAENTAQRNFVEVAKDRLRKGKYYSLTVVVTMGI